jgi:putative signal transducing protein
MPSSSSSSGASSGGKLVKVGYGQQQAEAEMVQGLLAEHGIPSMLRRAAGWDVPDFLAAGPHEVLVAEELAEHAREILQGTPGSD